MKQETQVIIPDPTQGLVGGLATGSINFSPSPLPNLSQSVPPLETLHILFYRHGNDPRTQSLNFSFPGDFKKAIDRGRRYCEVTGMKFIKVERFLTDLDERERKASQQD